jgi:ferredoxin
MDSVHFEPSEDRKSKVVGGIGDDKSKGYFDDEKMEDAQEAEESCPVNVIKVAPQS